MRFELDADQRDLQATVRRFAAEHIEPRRAEVIHGQPGFTEQIWSRLAEEVGVLGLTVSEADGGSGVGPVEAVVALEELGRVCAPLPVVTSLLAVELLQANGSQFGDLLQRIADGQARIGLPTGWTKPVSLTAVEDAGVGDLRVSAAGIPVPNAASLTHLVIVAEVSGEPTLLAVELTGDGCDIHEGPSLDLTQPVGTVDLRGAAARSLASGRGEVDALAAKARDYGSAFLAADSVGAAAWCLDKAVEWASEREQFGRPIGSNQAIKHMCTNAMMEIETARALTYLAAYSLSASDSEAGMHASLAKQQATDAFLLAAGQLIQILGGIGFTWEHPAHLYLRRARANAVLDGDREYHLDRVADEILAPYETEAGVR